MQTGDVFDFWRGNPLGKDEIGRRAARDAFRKSLPRILWWSLPNRTQPNPCRIDVPAAVEGRRRILVRFQSTIVVITAGCYNLHLRTRQIYGRVFRNIEQVRQAVPGFIERYKRQWRIGKSGSCTTYEMHAAKTLPEVA